MCTFLENQRTKWSFSQNSTQAISIKLSHRVDRYPTSEYTKNYRNTLCRSHTELALKFVYWNQRYNSEIRLGYGEIMCTFLENCDKMIVFSKLNPVWKFYGNCWVEFWENDHFVRWFSRKVHIISRIPVGFPNCSVDFSIQTLEQVLYVIYREYSDNFWYTLRLGIYPRDVKVLWKLLGWVLRKRSFCSTVF